MKVRNLLVISHAIVAGIVLVSTLAAGPLGTVAQAVVGASFAAISVLATGYLLARRFQGGITQLTSLTVDRTPEQVADTGVVELDEIARQWCTRFEKHEDIEANFRTFERELDAILTLLDRRHSGDTRTTVELRAVLSAIGDNMNDLTTQIQQDVLEIGRCTEEIVAGAGGQDQVVTKTADYIGQVSSNVDKARQQAEVVQMQCEAAVQIVATALQVVDDLSEGFGRLRSCSAASQKQLRALCDPSRQISGIVETISDVAARTDLLALNASIESIRAGEHGRGFAVVADEIRKLAEQTTQAAREIGVLAESLLTETNDSIEVITCEQAEIDADAGLLEAIGQQLGKLKQDAADNARRVQQITTAGNDQQQVIQNIAVTVEKLVDTSKADRTRADHACWAMKSLAKTTVDLDESIRRLRRCSNQPEIDSASSGTATLAAVLPAATTAAGHTPATGSTTSASDPVTI